MFSLEDLNEIERDRDEAGLIREALMAVERNTYSLKEIREALAKRAFLFAEAANEMKNQTGDQAAEVFEEGARKTAEDLEEGKIVEWPYANEKIVIPGIG